MNLTNHEHRAAESSQYSLFPQKQPEPEAATFWQRMGLWMLGEGPDPR